MTNSRAPRNRTIELTEDDRVRLRRSIVSAPGLAKNIRAGSLICADAASLLSSMSGAHFDLLFADPPYNLTKQFGKEKFNSRSGDAYEQWLYSWLHFCATLLRPPASVYICGDWRSSASIQRVGSRYFKLQNRITWE